LGNVRLLALFVNVIVSSCGTSIGDGFLGIRPRLYNIDYFIN
jgi:hypothetical protein